GPRQGGRVPRPRRDDVAGPRDRGRPVRDGGHQRGHARGHERFPREAQPRVQGSLSGFMPFRIKVSLIILAVLIAAVIVLPLVLPIAPPPGVRPLAEVAGPDAAYVNVAGVDLHVRRWEGEGDGPAFLLLHGFPYSTRTFDDLAPLLAARGDVVAVDLPGLGLTERPDPDEPDLGLDPYAPSSQPRLV